MTKRPNKSDKVAADIAESILGNSSPAERRRALALIRNLRGRKSDLLLLSDGDDSSFELEHDPSRRMEQEARVRIFLRKQRRGDKGYPYGAALMNGQVLDKTGDTLIVTYLLDPLSQMTYHASEQGTPFLAFPKAHGAFNGFALADLNSRLNPQNVQAMYKDGKVFLIYDNGRNIRVIGALDYKQPIEAIFRNLIALAKLNGDVTPNAPVPVSPILEHRVKSTYSRLLRTENPYVLR